MLVLVTAPNPVVARRMARELLVQRLIACANLVPGVESHYWWKGRVERGREILMLLKTRRELLVRLEKEVLNLHPYDTPEFLVVGLESGAARYLDWLRVETTP